MKLPPLFLSLVLTLWLGLYSLRSYVPAAVWNLADELPLAMKPLLAIAVNILAVVGIVFFRKAQRRALLPLALSFAVLTSARQIFTSSDLIGPWLALLSWPCWVWLVAALAHETASHRADALLAPAVATAFALQLGMQSAWHGLELPSVRGAPAVVITVVMGLLLYLSTRRVPHAGGSAPASAAWLLFGPAWFLLATLGAHAGRVSQLTGMALPLVIALLQLALLAAIYVSELRFHIAVRALVITAAVVATWSATLLQGPTGLLILIIPLAVTLGLRSLADRPLKWPASLSVALTMFFFFVLLFGFYNVYEFPPLWTVALVPLAVGAALTHTPRAVPAELLVLFAAAAVLTAFYLVPSADGGSGDNAQLTVLSYNIHQGFDDAGLPGMQQTARQIAELHPDLVALQEVGRGWTLLGGNDLIAYLRWRFPQYEIHFTPTNGLLWGNAVMSRLPVVAATGGKLDAEPGDFAYGWTQAMIQLPARHFEFYSVHLTADLEARGGAAREIQTRQLLDRVAATPFVMVAGDFNSHPDEAPIRLMRAQLTDLGERAGLGTMATWPAGAPAERIDYVFARGFSAGAGAIPRTLASDHLPVLVQVQIADTTPLLAASSNRSQPPRD